MSLDRFHPATRQWFTTRLGTPTTAQARGWEAIRDRRPTLIAAPTGSGKTLAAFLSALDDLLQEGLTTPLPDEVRVVYVSPLKALSADIHKNLAEPRLGIRAIAEEMGFAAPKITAAVRTGDTTSSERAAILRKPPHILVTTPESLYLLVTAERSREMLRSVRTVIVDEIHAVIGTRRGAHLALTLERLQQIAKHPLHRIGLSATQKPIGTVAEFLSPSDPCAIVDEGHRRAMDLSLEIPRSPLSAVMSAEVWSEYYDRLQELIRSHATTLVFVNTRKMAERVARHLADRLGEDAVTAHHGSLSKEARLDAERRLKDGQLKALVATASLELGIDIGHVDLVCQIGSPHRISTFLQRVGRSGHSVSGLPKGRIFPQSLDDLVECAALLRAVRRGELDRIFTHDAPLDVLAQQIVAEASCEEYEEDALYDLVRRAWPYRKLPRDRFDAVLKMVAEGFTTKRGRRAALVHRDEVNRVVRARRGSRMLALTSGGAIPEVADYRVVLEPDDTFIGTLNEDFAIESNVGDIFQLGNMSWQVLQVSTGVVRVADAKGAPPTIPFWLGEAPGRSDELSRAVSDLRQDIAVIFSGEERDGSPSVVRGSAAVAAQEETTSAVDWLIAETGIPESAAHEIVQHLVASHRVLGTLPTQETLVLERFFDQSGGMQLVLHAPFGSRINRAWGLALRKRFCRQFDFELQAAATEDALLLSLGPQHSFPLADVFRYLHPATARDVLVQAFLDAPVWQTRWRWNTTVSLAVPRSRGGKKVPPQLQRTFADDLMAAVFPDAAACFENIGGDREIPDHPLVSQAVRDCLEEAMDFPGLERVLTKIHAGELQLIARDTPEPSSLCNEIIHAKPYAFLDDAPLEERRTMSVQTGRSGELDAGAIERVRDEARPDPRDPDELHDALLTAGLLLEEEVPAQLFAPLVAARRAGRVKRFFVAAERLPEVLAIHPCDAGFAPPPSRIRDWSREEALVEIVRGRMTVNGPISAAALADSLDVRPDEAEAALLKLESEGVVLRVAQEWCDRRLLARIHRYTLNRLRAEIAPVTPADFQRFLFSWQHVAPAARLAGIEGLQTAVAQLDGFEAAAGAWERHILPARVEGYSPSMLDTLTLSGEVGWARLTPSSTAPIATTPIALFLRAFGPPRSSAAPDVVLTDRAKEVAETLRTRGASFARELDADPAVLAELVSAGLITSDGFAGLRSLIDKRARPDHAGRWSLATAGYSEDDIERIARALLNRYGVIFRRLLTREPNAPPWRDLARHYRTLEMRGDIRGGRFVSGMSGEQFALPQAVEHLREIRRQGDDVTLIAISAADPLNLVGILTAGERIRASASTKIAYRNGVAVSAMEGDFLKPLSEIEGAAATEVATLLAGRKVPVTRGFVGRVN